MRRPLLLALALLAAVPTITPHRRIVVTTKPVVVDMVIVTEQRDGVPPKTTVTPAPTPARPRK